MKTREAFLQWRPKDFQISMKVDPATTELLYGVAGEMGRPDYLIIGRNSGELFYVYHTSWYEYNFQKHRCTVESLREWLDTKIKAADKYKYPSEKSIVYWWRDDIKEFLNELEREERSGVLEGTSGTVQEA